MACGADEESSAGLCACVDREIHRRLRRLRQFVSGIAHDADYLVAMMTQGDEVLADRVLIWKMLPHEPSADDDFIGAIETLIGTEGAPAEERDAYRREIAGISRADDRFLRLPLRQRRMLGDAHAAVTEVSFAWNREDQ